MFLYAFLLFATPSAAAQPAKTSNLVVTVSGLRSTRGSIRLCMTSDKKHFPDCQKDPAALSGSTLATSPTIELKGVLPGDYAIAIFHDENDNRKLDTMMGIPREGFGFSRNPKIRFGPPHFDEVRITVSPGVVRSAITLKYLL